MKMITIYAAFASIMLRYDSVALKWIIYRGFMGYCRRECISGRCQVAGRKRSAKPQGKRYVSETNAWYTAHKSPRLRAKQPVFNKWRETRFLSSGYRVAKENPWRDSDHALFAVQREREREKLRNETGARAQRDVEKETICVPLGRNNLERSLPYLNFYATSYSTNNSCHVPHVWSAPRMHVTLA